MKQIKQHSQYYVTEIGEVYSVNSEIWLKPYDHKGYLRYNLSSDNRRRCLFAHRLVAEAYIPNPDNLPQVNHKDGNKFNNHWSNLEWCTDQQNKQHAINIIKTFSMPPIIPRKGENNPAANFTNVQVKEIRAKYATGLYSINFIAREYEVGHKCISRIVKRQSYIQD